MPTLEDFAGRWRLDRRIDDAQAGTTGRLEGTARFTPRDGGLDYHEEGRLRIGDGPVLAACQRHVWRPEGARVSVHFADGRPFHAFDPAETTPEARHDCPPDLYLVRYDFRRWPDWQAEWRVAGPSKSYRMVSRHGPA